MLLDAELFLNLAYVSGVQGKVDFFFSSSSLSSPQADHTEKINCSKAWREKVVLLGSNNFWFSSQCVGEEEVAFLASSHSIACLHLCSL